MKISPKGAYRLQECIFKHALECGISWSFCADVRSAAVNDDAFAAIPVNQVNAV